MNLKSTLAGAVAAAVALAASGALAGANIAIITPYLAQPGTQFYVEAFQEVAKENGWTVNVVDTKGDIAGVISRIEDAANQKVDAIVLNADPAQVTAGLETAKKAGVPVFGMDAGANPLFVTNVTSNGYEMAAVTASYVVNRIGGKGGVVMFVFDAFPPVQVRGVIADTIFKNNPDIKIIDRVTPDVQDGGIADSRARMEAILAANPKKGSIAAVWAAWDQRSRRSRRPAERTKVSSSWGWTPTRKPAKPSPRAAISRPRWRRTSRASAEPSPTWSSVT
jgi:ribose transport system substrate-binding protein